VGEGAAATDPVELFGEWWSYVCVTDVIVYCDVHCIVPCVQYGISVALFLLCSQGGDVLALCHDKQASDGHQARPFNSPNSQGLC